MQRNLGFSLSDSLLQGHPLECSICLERMKEISFLTSYPDKSGHVCDHYFCTKCIEPLVESAKARGKEASCPSCRRTVVAVHKSRVANELLSEIEKEREERKHVIALKEELQKQVDRLLEEKNQLELNSSAESEHEAEEIEKIKAEFEREKEALKQQFFKDIEKLNKINKEEMTKLKLREQQKISELNDTHQKQITSLMAKQDAEIKALNDKINEMTDLSEQLVKQTQKEQEKFKNERKLAEDLRTQLSQSARLLPEIEKWKAETEKWKNQVEKWKSESDKWQRMYVQLKDEIKITSRETQALGRVEKVESTPYLSSWLSPVKLSNPLSYIWNSRTGRLLRTSTEYRFVERRGSSFNSAVWKAVFRPVNSNIEKIVALKKVTVQHNPTDTWREAMILDKLEHKNILKLDGVLRDTVAPGNDNPSDFLVLPFVPFDLEFVMSDPAVFKGKANHIRYILYQVLSVLYYMHSGDICHRDIKPTSILLDESWNVKLGSFVNVRSVFAVPYPRLNMNRYLSPENIYNNDMKPSELKASDIWSLGCVFAEMLKGAPLFDARDKNALLSQIFGVSECRPNSGLIARYPALNGVPQVKSTPLAERFAGVDMPEDAMDLLQSMIVFDPVKRITAMEALQHKYFVGANYNDIHRTCPYSTELTDEEVVKFVNTECGGL